MDLNSSNTSGILKVIWDNKYFIIPFFLVFALILGLIISHGNTILFLQINEYHSKGFDFFFLNITHLGDGIIPFVLVAALLWISFRDAFTFLIITLLIIIVVTVLKRGVFPEFDRPVEYFGSSEVLRIDSGYNPPLLYTFPSGHSATSFSVFFYLSLIIKRPYIKFILFIVASSVSFSRIYLSAHFPADAFTGALIAVILTIFCYYWSRRIKNSWLDKRFTIKPKIFVKKQT